MSGKNNCGEVKTTALIDYEYVVRSTRPTERLLLTNMAVRLLSVAACLVKIRVRLTDAQRIGVVTSPKTS